MYFPRDDHYFISALPTTQRCSVGLSQVLSVIYTSQLLKTYPDNFTKLPAFICRRLWAKQRIEDLPFLSSVSDCLVQKQVLQLPGDLHR